MFLRTVHRSAFSLRSLCRTKSRWLTVAAAAVSPVTQTQPHKRRSTALNNIRSARTRSCPAPHNPGIPMPWEGRDQSGLESLWFWSSVAVIFVSRQNYNRSISSMAAFSAAHARRFYPLSLCLSSFPPAGQTLYRRASTLPLNEVP